MNHSEGVVWKRKGREMETHHLVSSQGYEINNNIITINNKKMEKKKKKIYNLISFKDLPDYMKDNEYILGYYRANWPLKEALFSVFRWHNETLNIWTHLLGFVLFLGLTIGHLMQLPQMADLLGKFTSFQPISASTNVSHNSVDLISGTTLIDLEKITHSNLATTLPAAITRWPFFVFLAGSMFCLLSSSVCHLFCCHSHRLNLVLLRFDYAGIAIMIITSFFPPIYYIFQCDPRWQFIYLAGITTMGIFTVITLLSPAASTAAFRSFRAMLFAAMGLSGIIPAIHALFINWNDPHCLITLAYEAAMALSYLIGTLFYVSRVPERWKPGWFDVTGHSHQIFHVFVIMGALAHYGAALIFLKWRGTSGCNTII